MSSKSRQKQPNFKGITASDAENKYKRKYKELKKKVRDMEEENEKLTLKLTKAKKNIQRLRIERTFLFDRLEQSQPTNESESEQSSSPQRAIDSEEELTSSQEGLPEGQGSSKRGKQSRDPNAPKRSRSARENQNKDFTRILNQECEVLSAEEKEKHFDMYKQDKPTCVAASSPGGDDNTDESCGGRNPSSLSRTAETIATTEVTSNRSNHNDHNGRCTDKGDDDDGKGVGSDFGAKEMMTDDDDELVSGSEEMIDELASDNGGSDNRIHHSSNNCEHTDETKRDCDSDNEGEDRNMQEIVDIDPDQSRDI